MTTHFFREINLSDSLYKKFADFIYKKSGINLGDNKQQLLKTRFQKRLRALGLDSFERYYDILVRQKDDEELVLMLDAISTNYTFFFREKEHFDFLSHKALPEIIQHKKSKGIKQMRIWCAASSTGEEPYSIMICVLEKMAPVEGWDIKMLATDISTKVLIKAKEGVYSKQQVKTVIPALMNKYFEESGSRNDKKYHVKPALKNNLFFRRFNLMNHRFPFKGKFDFIFCRNVMIYFDKPTQETLVHKMVQFLQTGGYLFIGHSETLSYPAQKHLKVIGPALYQKISH